MALLICGSFIFFHFTIFFKPLLVRLGVYITTAPIRLWTKASVYAFGHTLFGKNRINIYQSTYDAAVIILQRLYEMGYDVVTVSELFDGELEAGQIYYENE